jgi:xylulokinase
MATDYVLGLDSSTQSLTAVVIDAASMSVVAEHSISFDEAFPGYGTLHGVLPNDDPQVVHAPPLIWVDALDAMLTYLRSAGCPLERVAIIAGSGQQHGSVYLNASAGGALAALDAEDTPAAQLAGIFSRATCPVWLDSSTADSCRVLTDAIGGPAALWEITGSTAYERFTGAQIHKFAQTESQAWAETAHVRLVSSFMASVLVGRLAPTDHGDASGMNLLDIARCEWHAPLLDACAPGLREKLGAPVPSSHICGSVAPWLVQRHGLRPDALVMAWSGDNPNSLVGLGLIEEGMCALSLGTSDTFFAFTRSKPTGSSGEGHVFITPTGDYMPLLCYANGSLAREHVRDAHGLDWSGFQAAIEATPPGNNGALMIPWFAPEIVPKVLRPLVIHAGLSADDAGAECRAVVESQVLSRRLHAEAMGLRPQRIRITGGAARSPAIVQIAADVFQCPVECQETTNSAALGAALRALAGLKPDAPLPELVAPFVRVLSCTEPDPATAGVYGEALARYRELEADSAKA